jgi:large subunit ribosomal protein L10
MNRDQKAVAIAEIASHIDESEAIFAVDYRGISVAQIAELRTKLRDADATFKVVKNSLTERAADESGAQALKEYLAGPTALTFVRGDIAVAAKAIADYARATQLLPFKGGMMGEDALDVEQIRSLSRLPSREVLYGQLVGVVASPVTGLVRSLGQVREKKESGEIPAGEAPAEELAAAEPAAEEPAAEEPAVAEPAAEEPAAEEPAAAEPAAEEPNGEEPAAEEAGAEAPAAEATAGADEKAEPEPSTAEDTQDAPAQEDDKQADVSAEAQPEDAETNPTKED